MTVKYYYFPGIILSCTILCLSSCREKQRAESIHFTKADSLTETYLNLKEMMFETWSSMINDDNQKIKAMRNLLHELRVSDPAHRDEFDNYQKRLDQLTGLRYTQKSMANAQVIEEYDFASNSLVTELIALAESQSQFSYNTTLQKLVESIRTAEQRVDNYRVAYDRVASAYNQFLDNNQLLLKEIDPDTLEKKPLFQMVAEE
jgi:hypothetical protein